MSKTVPSKRTRGSRKWASWVKKNGLSWRKAGVGVGVSSTTAYHWAKAIKRPEVANQDAIAAYTGGAIVRADWGIARARHVDPFVAAAE